MRLRARTFVKPADPLDKWFDAGVYADPRDIRTARRERPDAPVLLSEPVEWSVEFRYSVLEGKPVAGSPYIAYGRSVWNGTDSPMPPAGLSVVHGVCESMKGELPPAFVIDVGVIEGRGWAVVDVQTSEQAIRAERSKVRFHQIGFWVGAGFLILLTGYGFLRLDAWTKGYLTTALGVVAVLLVGGGILAMALAAH